MTHAVPGLMRLALRTAETPAFEVDALGGGEVVHVAFALGVAKGIDITDIVVQAAIAAAVKCATGGGREGFPTEADVAVLLEE
ncbi:MAG: hypothetical protein ACR2NG_00895 [Acidimicrobiia bacterium]